MTYALAVLLATGLLVYSVLGIATTHEQDVQRLPRPVWLLLVVLLPVAGPLAWLTAGRPARTTPARSGTGGPSAGSGRRGRPAPSPPDDDEAFLRSLRARAEEQRRRAEREGGGDGEAGAPER